MKSVIQKISEICGWGKGKSLFFLMYIGKEK